MCVFDKHFFMRMRFQYNKRCVFSIFIDIMLLCRDAVLAYELIKKQFV